jgi:hypothetical protein
MSEKKGWASSLKGLFVEPDEGAGGSSGRPAADSGAEETAATGAAVGAAPAAAPAAPGAASGAVPGAPAGERPMGAAAAAPGGKLDFAAIYTAAGIGPEEQERVAKAAELLSALPAGTEAARQIVEASLKAFGVPLEKIIASGEREIQALDAYAEADAADTRKVFDDSNRRIAQYEQEIQRIRQEMDARAAEQQAVARACAGGKLDLVRVLGFFGHAPATPTGTAAVVEPVETRRAAMPAIGDQRGQREQRGQKPNQVS